MEDYKEKIEKLPPEKLKNLLDRYRKTMQYLEVQLREARAAAMIPVVEYTEQELAKKRKEVVVIEELLAKKAG